MSDSTQQSDRRNVTLAERIKKAEEAYSQAPDKNVADLAGLYLDDGRPQDAARILEKGAESADGKVLLAQARFDLFDNQAATELLNEAAQKGGLESNLRAQLLLGELAFEAGKSDDAKKYLKKVRSLDSNNRRAAQLLSNLGESVDVPEEDAGLDEDLEFRTEDHLREKPKRAVSHIAMGFMVFAVVCLVYVWWARRNYEATEAAREAIEMMEMGDVASLREAEGRFMESLDITGTEHAVAGLAMTYAMLYAHHGLEEAQPDAAEWVGSADDDDIERADRYAAKALFAIAEGRYADAEAVGAEVIERGGVSEKVYWTLGQAQRATGKDKLGRDNLRRAQESSTKSPHYALLLADAYDEAGDKRNASLFWEKAYRANSSYTPGTARWIGYRANKGEDKKKLLEELAKLDAESPESVGKLGRGNIATAKAQLYYHGGKTAEAVKFAEEAIGLLGETPRLLSIRGHALIADGKVKLGLASLQQAHDKAPHSPKYYYALARAYAENDQAAKAVKVLNGKRADYAEDAAFHIALGNAHARAKGGAKKARAAYEKALAIKEKHPEAFYGLGKLAWSEKKNDDATSWFEKAVGARSKYPEVYEAIGLMWISQGAASQANTQLEEADKQFKARGYDAIKMQAFYARVIKALASNRGGSSFLSSWVEREKALRNGS